MKKTLYAILTIALLGISVQTCKKKSTSAIQLGSLTVLPADLTYITGLVPLGNLNPPEHTFPTDHMYFYFSNQVTSFDLKSPGNLHVVQLIRQRMNPGQPDEKKDYSVIMGSGSTRIRFAHVTQLQGKLLDAASNFPASGCETTTIGGKQFEKCTLNVDVNVSAGELIGTIFTNVPGQYGFDLGIYVNNIPVCPLDYFDSATRSQLITKLGSPDGSIKRTAEPLCGEINQDIPGTLQGNWIQNGYDFYKESYNISFAKDEVQPDRLFLSIGDAGVLVPSGLYEVMNIQSSGVIDRAFKDVKPDGKIYAYNVKFFESGNWKNRSVLVRLEDNTHLSVEARDVDANTLPYTFTAAKKTYHR